MKNPRRPPTRRTAPKKTRNAQDATRRNVQAANKRWAGLENRVTKLETVVGQLLDRPASPTG